MLRGCVSFVPCTKKRKKEKEKKRKEKRRQIINYYENINHLEW